MFRQGPPPSPGPRIETLPEPNHDSSEVEDSENENTAANVARHVERAKQPLKRKDNDRSFTSASVAKRPKHEKEGRGGPASTGDNVSAPGPSSSSRPSLSASSQAGPTRIASGSSAPSASAPRPDASFITRKVDASQVASNVPKPSTKPPRPQFQRISVFGNPEKDVNGASGSKKSGRPSLQQHGFLSSSSTTRPSSSASSSKPPVSKGKRPASQVNKSAFTQNEVIEISSDSEPSSRPRVQSTSKPPKPSNKPDSKKMTARKRTGDGPRPIVRKSSPDFIIIDDSEEERGRPPRRFSQSAKESGPSTKVTDTKASTPPSHSEPMLSEADIAIETDNATHATSGTAPDMDADQIVQAHPPIATPIITSPPAPTATSPISVTPLPTSSLLSTSNEIEPASPSTSSISLSAPLTSPTNQSPAKKPTFNRQGLNPLPAPPLDEGEDDRPLSPPRRKIQSGTKTASMRKRIVSSPPSSGDEKSSGASGRRSRSATGLGAASSAAEDGMDMRNLSDALDVAVPSSKPRTPEQVARAKKLISSPQFHKVTDSPTHKQTARKSTSTNPPKIAATARKSMGGMPPTTLAEAITSAGLMNAASRHHGKKRGSVASMTSLTSDREEIPANNPLLRGAKTNGSKILAKALAENKGKRPDAGPSSPASLARPLLGHTRNRSSRSGTDELLLRSAEASPPATPSPVLPTASIPRIQPHSSAVPLASDLTVRPRSAPSLGELLPETQARPSASVLQSSRTVASVPSFAHPSVQAFPSSMDLVPQQAKAEIVSKKLQSATRTSDTSPRTPLHSPKLPTRQPLPTSALAPALPISPKSPKSPHSSKPSAPIRSPKVAERKPTSSPSLSPKSPKLVQPRISSFFSPSKPSSFHEALTRTVGENTSGTGSGTVTTIQTPPAGREAVLVSVAKNVDDADVVSDFEGRYSSVPPPPESSDDEAMDEAAEVEAKLIEGDEMEFEVEHTWDKDETTETSVVHGMARRSSGMSSRSSVSENWRASADDHFDSPDISRQATPEEGIVVHRGKTYGGFSAISWPGYVKNARNLPPKCVLAKDIPHVFEDHVNNMTWHSRMMPEMRQVYEARIMENTVEDEPDAPPIEIQNDVDDEATPPWEFYYSNKMWHGEGVPLPDTKSLKRCNCKGVCSPKSKTCACLKRQKEACQDPNVEFAYDKTGKLKIPGYPIFECNDLCGCGDECRNRVVQHGRKVSVAIRKTQAKGWGVFATKKIPAGSFIGIYAGELITDVVAQERGVKYNKFGRTYLFDIDFHHLRDADDQDWTNQFTVDAYHAGNFTRFLNHSCDPNSRLFACYINEGNIQKPLLVIFSLRDIEPDEEVCFNYQGEYPGEEDENDRSGSQDIEEPHVEHGTRDIIYERCMCGAYNCTGVMFK